MSLNLGRDLTKYPHLYVEDGTVHFHNGVELGEIYMEVDGYYVWVPSRSNNGCWEAFVLRELANLLEAINEPWDAIVRNDPVVSDVGDRLPDPTPAESWLGGDNGRY